MASDRIRLRGIRAWARHGVEAHERDTGQVFLVDVDLAVDLAPAGASDELDDTIDYGSVAATVADRVTGTRHDLVEAVADDLAAALLAHDPRVEEVEVTVHKPHAPVTVDLDDVAVTIRRTR